MSQSFLLSLPVFLLLGVGAVFVRLVRTSEDAESLALNLVIHLFLPCFIFKSVLGVENVKNMNTLFTLLGVGFGVTVLQLFCSLGAANLLGLSKGEGKRTFAVSCGLLNYGFLPIPLIQGLFGSGAVLASLLVHNVGFELAIWSVAISFYRSEFSWKKMLNMPLLALVAALVLTISETDSALPLWVLRFVEMAGAAAIPLGLVLAGMAIGHPQIGLKWKDFLTRWKISLGTLTLRLGVFPLLLLTLACLFQKADFSELAAVLGVHAAMPAAAMPVVLARHYGGNPSVAIQICLLSTVCSFLTTPLWLALAAKWLGW